MSDKLLAYWQLIRADKPVGIYLLLWPTLWAVVLSSQNGLDWHIVVVFTLGVIFMRSAGCAINDYADRNVDGEVERTAQRPIVSGKITANEALMVFVVLALASFLLVLTLSWATVALSIVALVLASLYPFMKRFTYYPQFFLGAAFSWGIPMACMAQMGEIPAWAWLMYLANLIWTVAYDTFYAMVDREDDLKVGVKSTAILFGEYDRVIIGLMQLGTVLLLLLVGNLLALSPVYYISVAISASLFVYQINLAWGREREACFKAFLHSHYAGLVILVGLTIDYLLV